MNTRREQAVDWPIPCQRQGAGGRQPEPERGKLGPRDGIPYQTANRLPVSNQDILGFWTVDIRWEGRSQRSAPQKRHTRHTGDGHSQGHPGIQAAGTPEVIRCNHRLWRVSSQAHGHLSFSDWGRVQNAGPTESALLLSTRESELEWLRPGNCMQPRAHSLQSNLKPEQCSLGNHTHNELGQSQCGRDTASTPHKCQWYLFAVLPSPHSTNEQVSLNEKPPLPPCVRAESRH